MGSENENKQELDQNRDTNAKNKNKSDNKRKYHMIIIIMCNLKHTSSEIIDNEISMLNLLNDMPSALTEAITRSKAARDKRKINKNKRATTLTILIETIINILLIILMKITYNALGIMHNKPDINQTLLTMIDITIAIEIIKPIIRIKHKQIIEDSTGIRIIKTVTTETSVKSIIIIIIILIRKVIEIMKIHLIHSPTQIKIMEQRLTCLYPIEITLMIHIMTQYSREM